MKKGQYYPTVFATFSAIIAFIAGAAISSRTFNLDMKWSVSVGMLVGLLFHILSYFRAKASVEIKRITKKFNLTSSELAKITGLRESDFPIYNGSLNLIVPKKHWPKILDRLQEYERAQESNK